MELAFLEAYDEIISRGLGIGIALGFVVGLNLSIWFDTFIHCFKARKELKNKEEEKAGESDDN